MKSPFIIIFCCFALFSADAQRTFSIEEAVSYAQQNSNQVRLAQLERVNAEASINEVRTAAIPKLTGQLDYRYNLIIPESPLPAEFFGGEPGTFEIVQFGLTNNLVPALNLNSILFDPTVFIGLKAAKVYRELVNEQLDQTEFELRYNVEKAYLAVLIAEKNAEIVQDNISNLQKTLGDTRAIFEEGFAEKLDVDRLQLSLDNLTVQLENIQQLIQVSYNILKFQMGYPIEEPIELTNEIDALVDETAINDEALLNETFAIENRPEYGTIVAGAALNEKDIDRQKAARYPSLYAIGAYQNNFQFDSESSFPAETAFIGASLQVPIFNGMATKYKVQQAEVTLRKTEVELNEFERAATLEYQNARISYLNNKRTVAANERSLDLAQRIYDTTQIKYREGVGSSLEVTQAESELYQAQGNYISSLYDLLVAKTDLEKALGLN
ncbi:MAG: TolC family protein [Bacteroidota bacterium]